MSLTPVKSPIYTQIEELSSRSLCSKSVWKNLGFKIPSVPVQSTSEFQGLKLEDRGKQEPQG